MNVNLSADDIEFIYEQSLYRVGNCRQWLEEARKEKSDQRDIEWWRYNIERAMKILEKFEKYYNDIEGSETAAKDLQVREKIRI
jgi:hypothetical protein